MKHFEISKAVIEREGKYLLLKRAAHSANFPNLWDFAGGKNEPEESPKESAKREAKEETSFDIEPGKEIFKASYQDGTRDITFHYFAPTRISGELKLSADHSEYKWLDKNEIKSLELHPAVPLFFKN